MAEETIYRIITRYEVLDHASAPMERVERQSRRSAVAFDAAYAGVKRLAVAYLSFRTAKAAVENVIGLNRAIEDQRLGMASVIQANVDWGHSLAAHEAFQQSMRLSNHLMEDFERTAMRAPGGLEDFIQIAQLSLGSFIKAGGDVNKDLSRFIEDILVTSRVIGVDTAQAARDMQAILEGRAGVDVRTFSALRQILGMTTEQFNKLALPQRFTKIWEALRKFASPEVKRELEDTWTTQWATFLDLSRQIFRKSSGEVFEGFKGWLKGVNNALEQFSAGMEEKPFEGAKSTAYKLGEAFVDLQDYMNRLAASTRILRQDIESLLESAPIKAMIYAHKITDPWSLWRLLGIGTEEVGGAYEERRLESSRMRAQIESEQQAMKYLQEGWGLKPHISPSYIYMHGTEAQKEILKSVGLAAEIGVLKDFLADRYKLHDLLGLEKEDLRGFNARELLMKILDRSASGAGEALTLPRAGGGATINGGLNVEINMRTNVSNPDRVVVQALRKLLDDPTQSTVGVIP